MIISKTPFRLSFFGGSSDYPKWYNKHRGSVLSTTIDKYVYVQCRYLPSFFEHNYRIVYSQTEDVDKIKDIDHPSVRESLRFMGMENERMEIVHTADISSRTGLGTSSSFTVGLLNALYALQGKMVSKMQLAQDAIHVEQYMCNEVVGIQDQTIASFGGFKKIDFGIDGVTNVQPVTIDQKKIDLLEKHLILFYTKISRTASEIAKEQVNQMQTKEKEMHKMVEMVDKAIDILNEDMFVDNIEDFGKLLHESWMIKRSLSNKITNQFIDEIYEKALDAGAIGGKISGAGGGGCVLFFIKPKDQNGVRQKMKELGLQEIEFKFSNEGSKIIYYDP